MPFPSDFRGACQSINECVTDMAKIGSSHHTTPRISDGHRVSDQRTQSRSNLCQTTSAQDQARQPTMDLLGTLQEESLLLQDGSRQGAENFGILRRLRYFDQGQPYFVSALDDFRC